MNKRAGQTVQPEPGKPESLEEQVKQYIKTKYEKPGEVFLGVIHRLDMPVSGVVLFARTSKSLTRMNELFRKRDVSKIYIAKVEGKPPKKTDTITHYLLRDEQKNITRAYEKEVEGSEKAMLTYEVTRPEAAYTLLKVNLHTGRKHQIRVQLAAMGCPIAGDVKYGASKAYADGAISLHAWELSFEHPVTKKRIKIVSERKPF